MFGFFRKAPILLVTINGKELCRVGRGDIPCERTPSIRLEPGSRIEFLESTAAPHAHGLGPSGGWFHFSIRVQPNMACQADCVITESEKYDSKEFSEGRATAIRFQPFFLADARVKNEELHGLGLFARGLHFNGTVTRGNVLLSCECDHCRKPFLIRSYHAGFNNVGYFYSGSGKHTLFVSNEVPGCPAALSTPDPAPLAALEASLPKAPDGSPYRFMNPFRCPHCSKPYIDFEAHPEERPSEYYGNCLLGSDPIHYEPAGG